MHRLLAAHDVRDLRHEARKGRHEIDDAGRDRGLRHHHIVGLVGFLHEDDAAGLLDGAHAKRPVGAGAAQHHGGAVASRGGDGPEEHVDRRTPPTRLAERPSRQIVTLDHELAVGRDDVDAVRLQLRRALDGMHRHARARRQYLRERARLIRREMHDDDIGEAEVVGDLGKEGLQRRDAAGGRPHGAYRREGKVVGVQIGQGRCLATWMFELLYTQVFAGFCSGAEFFCHQAKLDRGLRLSRESPFNFVGAASPILRRRLSLSIMQERRRRARPSTSVTRATRNSRQKS